MSPTSQILAKISGPIVMVGFGSIGKGTLPMISSISITTSRVLP
jgi:homospermidine synthase